MAILSYSVKGLTQYGDLSMETLFLPSRKMLEPLGLSDTEAVATIAVSGCWIIPDFSRQHWVYWHPWNILANCSVFDSASQSRDLNGSRNIRWWLKIKIIHKKGLNLLFLYLKYRNCMPLDEFDSWFGALCSQIFPAVKVNLLLKGWSHKKKELKKKEFCAEEERKQGS